MPKTPTSRKQLFRAALAIAGMTADQWARKQSITPSYLSYILSGKRESEEISAKIEQFIQKHLVSTNALVA